MSHAAERQVDPELMSVPAGHLLARLPRIGLVVFAVFFVAALGLGMGNRPMFHHAWLVSFCFFLSIGLGGLVFVLIHHVTRAGWSVVVRRLAENAATVLPWMALLFLPVLFGIHELYHWSHPDVVAQDEVLTWKAPYLNEPFFVLRAIVYFLVWSLMARWFRRVSVDQDRTGDHELTRRLQWASGFCLLLYAFTVTFAAFDWLMSLDPHWFSTIFGGYFWAGGLISIFAFLVVMVLLLQWTGLIGDAITKDHYWDLGKLLFAFTVFWAYLAFSQFMLIWYSNLPEETGWFRVRMDGSWKAVSLFLLVGHFIVPFFFLMPRTLKKNPVFLLLAAKWMLLMHFVDLFWITLPQLFPEGPGTMAFRDWALVVCCYLAVGGGFIAVYSRNLVSAALLPVKDPRLPESLAFENF